MYTFSNSNFKISVPKCSIKLTQNPVKMAFMKQKGTRLLVVAFPDEFRIYRDKEIVYRHQVEHRLYSVVYGSFAKEQNCLVLLYEQNGF